MVIKLCSVCKKCYQLNMKGHYFFFKWIESNTCEREVYIKTLLPRRKSIQYLQGILQSGGGTLISNTTDITGDHWQTEKRMRPVLVFNPLERTSYLQL